MLKIYENIQIIVLRVAHKTVTQILLFQTTIGQIRWRAAF